MSLEDDSRTQPESHICRIFPLPGVVLFPHVVLPLHIFEPRYRQMTQDALAHDQHIVIVQARPDLGFDAGGEPLIENTACLGQIITHQRLEDGRFNLLLLGCHRIHLDRELEVTTLYRQMEARIIPDIEPLMPEAPNREVLSRLFRDAMAVAGPLDPDLDRVLQSEISLSMLTDLIAYALGLPPLVQQQLLAEPSVETRAACLIRMLRGGSAGASTPPRHPPYPPSFSDN